MGIGVGNKYAHAEGRREQTKHKVEYHQNTKMNGIDPESRGDGQKDGGSQDNDRDRIHEHTENQVQNCDDRKKSDLADAQIEHKALNHIRKSLNGQHPAEQRGHAGEH